MPIKNNASSLAAFRELLDIAASKTRPLLVWVGAGASRWCGYPGWKDLAEGIHKNFKKYEPEYDVVRAAELIAAGQFPTLFSLAYDVNPPRYFTELAKELRPRPTTPVYDRFGRAVRSLKVSALTTNVDDQLERQLPEWSVVDSAEIERALSLLTGGQEFLGHLHGTSANISAAIFREEDYRALVSRPGYATNLARLLAATSVVFVGYGLADDYLLKILADNASLAKLFGDGPHFALLPSAISGLPPSVKVVEYETILRQDHRAQIAILEELAKRYEPPARSILTPQNSGTVTTSQTSHLLFDVYPPGTWATSQTLTLEMNGQSSQLVIGTGFTDQELPGARVTAFHDLIVGLLCFDVTYAPVTSVGRVHKLVGEDLLTSLSANGTLKFLHWTQTEGVFFKDPDALAGGELLPFQHFLEDQKPFTSFEAVTRQIKVTPGREREGRRIIDTLLEHTSDVGPESEGDIAELTRSVLLRPSVRQLIGMSEGTPLSSIARWQVFPVLRVAHVAKVSAACAHLGINSAKISFGTAALASPAFSLAEGVSSAEEAASYIVSGRFLADLDSHTNPVETVKAVLNFRDTQEGAAVRKAVAEALSNNKGADLAVSINSSLSVAIPGKILETARQKFVQLLTKPGVTLSGSTPALWNDQEDSTIALERMRKRFRKERDTLCEARGIGAYHECPCGSGDKFKFCCGAV